MPCQDRFHGTDRMNPITTLLAHHRPIIVDGAMATELEARGCDLNDALWSARILIEQPALIKAVHADYFAAGADVAITASYQATFEGFAKRGLSHDQAVSLMRQAVALALAARNDFWQALSAAEKDGRPRPLVAASVGPYGAMLADGSEYRGDYGLSETALMDFHRERMRVLIDAGADLLACETIPCAIEARAVSRLLREFPGVYGWITFSCRDDRHTCQGELLSDCVAELNDNEQIAAIGINCTAPRFVTRLVSEARQATAKPIIVYPNSGEDYDAEHHCWRGSEDGGSFADQALRWQAAGASLIGGCCRTTPADIRAMAQAMGRL